MLVIFYFLGSANEMKGTSGTKSVKRNQVTDKGRTLSTILSEDNSILVLAYC